MDVWIKWVYGWMDKQIDQWFMDGWMGGWMNE